MKQTDLRAGCKLALQPGTMTDHRSETFFSLPRIKVQRSFLISKGRLTDRLESTTALSILNGSTSFFVASRSIAEVNDFSKKYRSYRTGVAMIWLKVKVNRTRLCTAPHFAISRVDKADFSIT